MSASIFHLFEKIKVSSTQEKFETDLAAFKEEFERLPENKKTPTARSFHLTLSELISPKFLDFPIPDEYKSNLYEVVEFLNRFIKPETNFVSPIPWLGTPAQLAVFICELADAGWIACEKHDNIIVYNQLAKDTLGHFKFLHGSCDYKLFADHLNPKRRNKRENMKFYPETLKIPKL
jgi:hypothetical protein